MKNVTIAFWSIIFILSYSNSRAVNNSNMEEQNVTVQLPDSMLQSLYQNNKMIIGVASETFGWGHHATYHVFVLNSNDEWSGYSWYASYRPVAAPVVTPVTASKDTCNALLNFLQQNNIDKIQGDRGEPGCADKNNRNCNINDGATWHLFWLTKEKMIAPSYYEPQYFENCCPGNTDRRRFLDVVNRIMSSMGLEQKGR